MGTKKLPPWSREARELARSQHWVVTRAQLLELGLGPEAIRHRLRTGALRRLMRGVYAVGRPEANVPQQRWMAAVLACGPHARLSHCSAAALWGMRAERPGPVDILVPAHVCRRRPDIRLHRRAGLGSEGARAAPAPQSSLEGIPVTSPASTLVDLAMCVSRHELEEAVNEADHRDRIDPESLREALDSFPRRPGIARLRRLLDRETFVLTQTRLEQLFLPLARAAGLPLPQTQVWLGKYRVDFYWPDLGLVVETDSLRYHRTPIKQAADNRRDQEHIAAGRMPLRFSHWQVSYERDHVRKMLAIAHRQRG